MTAAVIANNLWVILAGLLVFVMVCGLLISTAFGYIRPLWAFN